MLDTSTSPAWASDEVRAPVDTATPTILPFVDLALPGMETRADLDPQLTDVRGDLAPVALCGRGPRKT